MIVKDTYEVNIDINNDSLIDDSLELSFSISDSIHRLFPTMKLSFNDFSGLFQEFLLNTEGVPLSITYGIKDGELLKCNFVVQQDQLEDNQSPGVLNGPLEVDYIHEYHDKQEIRSKAYDDRISAIVREFASKYSFSAININDTGNKGIWYQPLLSDAEYMEKILLPNAFSKNADNSPFFLFIDTNNEFNFKNYKSMASAKPINITFYPEIQNSAKQTNAISIGRFRLGSQVTYKNRYRSVLDLTNDAGELEEDSDYIYSYPELQSGKVPIVSENSYITDYIFLGFTKTEPGDVETFQAPKINSMKNSLFLDKVIVTTYLNAGLRAGKTISLDIPTRKSDSGEDISLLYRGDYLIEESKHVWDGKKKAGYSKFIASRRAIDVPDYYQIKSKLIG